MFGRRCVETLISLELLLSAAAPPAFSQFSELDARNRAADLANEAVRLLNDNKLESAERKLIEARRLDPDNAALLCNFGNLLLKQGKLEEARKTLERSLQLDPKLDASYLNLGLVLEGAGDLAGAKKNLLKYIEITSNREQAEKFKEHVAMIEKNMASGLQQPPADSNDYFGSEVKVYRWPKNRMPIKIYIAHGTQVEGYKESYGTVLLNALESWAAALQGLVGFETIDKPDAADIEIRWTHDFKNALTRAEGGDCKFNMNGEGMNHAGISLLTVDPSASDKLNDFRVSWVCLHELGHALGFSGHSNNPGDVMYFSAPLKSSMPALSSRDVQTFKRLYTERLPDTYMSLNDEAVKLMRAGRCQEAVPKLEAALKLNPEEKNIRSNLALAESTIAVNLLNDGKYGEAEQHIRRGLEFASGEGLDSLLKNYDLLLEKLGRAGEKKAIHKQYGRSSE